MRNWPTVLAALLSICACRQSEAPPPPAPSKPAATSQPAEPVAIAELEPNDFQRAQLIPSRAIVSGTIAPPRPRASDEDWYRVAPGPGVLLALSLELKGAQGSHGAQPMELALFDRDRNQLFKLPAVSGESALLPAVACSEACFVVVSGAVAEPYTLTVLGAPPAAGHELEPNGRAIDANELTAGKPMQGTLASGDDEDWYRLQIAAPQPGQFLRIEVSGVAELRPELEVRALSDGALLATVRAAGAGEAIFVRDLALGLGDAKPDAGPPGPGNARPDAGLTDAGPSGLGDAKPDAGSAQDAGAQVGAAAEPLDGRADAGALAGAAPGPATSSSAAPAPSAVASPLPSAPPPPPAGYYLVLKSGFLPAAGKARPVRGHNSRVPYTLLASLESGPADLEREPNDDPAHASDLSVRGTATGFLAPAGDVDWYRVHAEVPMVLHVEVTGLDRADLELSAWAPPSKPGDKPTLLARANEGGVKEGEVLPAVGVPAGDSYLKIESALRQLEGKWVRDGEDRSTPYKLTTLLVPDDGSLEREPNNDPDTAQPVTLPAGLKGYLWPHKDLDVFRFHVGPEHAPINIHLGAVRGLDLSLRLFELKPGKDGKTSAEVIGSADATHGEGEEELLEVPVREGDYAVEVSSPRGKDASATLPYQLTIK